MQSLVAVDFNEVFDWNFHLRHIIEIAQEEMLVFNSAPESFDEDSCLTFLALPW